MNELLSSGIELMLIGMTIVFGFLAMLIVAIKGMAALIERFFPDMPVNFGMSQHGDDPGIIAAIAAAVHQYRTKYPKH